MRRDGGWLALVAVTALTAALSMAGAGIGAEATPAAPAAADAGLAQSVADLFIKGGSLMWVLLLASVVGMTFTLERMVALRAKQHLPPELEQRLDWLLAHEGLDAGREYLERQRNSLARCLRAVLGDYGAGRRAMAQGLEDELARIMWDERRNIRPVGMVATVAPLLGLLGTVIGMIDAFRSAAESGMDNPAQFAGGIYMALYTTAFGLLVAIPFLVIYHWLRGRVELLLRRVEDRALAYLHTVDGNADEERSEAA